MNWENVKIDFLLKSSGQIVPIRRQNMGPQFFQTGMGAKFYNSDVPRIADALKKIADNLERQNKLINLLGKITQMEHLQSLAEAAQEVLNDNSTIEKTSRLNHLETETVRALDFLDDCADQINQS
jgi:hypothetical protein